MAKRSIPQEPKRADLSIVQMQAAIPKLEKRIQELESLDPGTTTDISDSNFESMTMKLDDTLVDLFGRGTVEYERFEIGDLYKGPLIIGGTPIPEIRRGFSRGVERAKSTLKTIIDLFKEKIQDSGVTPQGRASSALSGMTLHPEVERAVSTLFKDGHYANAIEDACKVLDALVKMRSGKFDLSGTELMQTVFSPKNPILRFNDGATETERSEQQGMMFLYAGAMLAFRNPRAHGLIEDDPETAVQVISFIGFLANELDKARK